MCLSYIISGAVFSEAPKYSTLSRNLFCTIGAADMNQIKRLVEERFANIFRPVIRIAVFT